MGKLDLTQYGHDLDQLCELVRAFVVDGAYESCIDPICRAMERYPHAPQPHNLLGIVLEKTGHHPDAMKHFRAAWALDPTYLPASCNLDTYGSFFSNGRCAFDESDVAPERSGNVEVVFDKGNVGRVVSKNKIEYDEHGIGHVVRK